MRDYGALVVIPAMLFAGWACTFHPTTVIRVMTYWLPLDSPTGELNKGQQFAKYVREHPETWPQQYPFEYKQLRFVGFGAYLIFVVGVFIVLMSWFVPSSG